MVEMDVSQKIGVLTWKLCKIGDITEQESDEIFSAAYNLFRCGLDSDKNLIATLTSWYNEVYNQLKNGKDGKFVSTLPLVPIEPGINGIVDNCLNLLPWHKKTHYAGLPAKVLPISRLPGAPKGRLPRSFDVAEGITLYRTNRRINITTLISDRAALFQKVNVKADLNEYVGIDAESSAAKNWWGYYFNEKSGQVSNRIFLSSCDDLWLHVIMKIAERMKIRPLFVVTYDDTAGIYVDKNNYERLRPYLPYRTPSDVQIVIDKSIINKTVETLEYQRQIELDKAKYLQKGGWMEIIR